MAHPADAFEQQNPEAASFLPRETTFDEMEEQSKQPEVGAETTPTDYNTVKLDGDHVPEGLRGMSAAQLMERTQRLEQALAISERGRTGGGSAPVPAPTAPAGNDPAPLNVTEAQLREMMETDPLQAMAAMVQIAEQRAEARFNARLAPLTQGARGSAEAAARAKYAEDFEMFGSEIAQVVQGIPDAAALSNPQTWDSVVSYVRGQNIDKIVAHRMEKERAKDPSTARENAWEMQSTAAPARVPTRSEPQRPANTPSRGLDATALEICKVMGITPEEYIRYR